MTPQLLEEIVAPDISELVIEDDTPVDNFQSAKQQRLLVEPLYASWSSGVPFIADANVGLFYALKQDPLVPDAFLSLHLQMPADWSQKQNRSYFVWEFGKVPEVCIEIVSNRKGNELDSKKDAYARIGVAHYVVFDPLQQLQRPDELDGALLKVWTLTAGRYEAAPEPFWLEAIGLGLMVWQGVFEEQDSIWLRWCDRSGQVIPTGAEGRELERQGRELERQGRELERQRADGAEAKAQRLAEKLRAMGIDPDEV
jgi:Uma2 family endonuclease